MLQCFHLKTILSIIMFINMRIAYEQMRFTKMEKVINSVLAVLRPFTALARSRKFWLYVAIQLAGIFMYSNGLIDPDRLSEMALYGTAVLTGAIAFEDGMKWLGGLIGITSGSTVSEQK